MDIAPSLFLHLQKIAQHEAWSDREKFDAAFEFLTKIFVEGTKAGNLSFSTLFARISYAGHIYQMPNEDLLAIHTFRRSAARLHCRSLSALPNEKELFISFYAVALAIKGIYSTELPIEIAKLFPGNVQQWLTFPDIVSKRNYVRVVALEDFPMENYFLCRDEEYPENLIKVLYALPERNDSFEKTILSIRSVFGLPVTLQLLDVEIDKNGYYRPRGFVLEPDYLIDVSAISECFHQADTEPYQYLVRKFMPYEAKPSMILGNVANYFLDKLLTAPDESDFRSTLLQNFKDSPLTFMALTDAEVRQLAQDAQKHYVHLYQMVKGGLQKQQIEPEYSFLEPSFYSEKYGIQGRLDLFYKHGDQSAIVELKSGAAFKPNAYGITRSHFTQTLLYGLLIRSVYKETLRPAKYILYSKQDVDQLRFAPDVDSEQMESIQVRNKLVIIDKALCKVMPGAEFGRVFARLRPRGGSGFLEMDFARFTTVYEGLSTHERTYFNSFAGFIAREQWLAKVGENGNDNANGNAALWLNTYAEKEKSYTILSHLHLVENKADSPEPYIIFQKTAETNHLANFRIGDLVALYPSIAAEENVLNSQVIKCTIIELSKAYIKVALRFRQHNLRAFQTSGYWNLEPDGLDSSFNAMFRGLFEWAAAPVAKRQMLLTSSAPRKAQPLRQVLPTYPQLTEEQRRIFEEIVKSQDYYLLWGPPGTGKTSIMLKHLADYWLHHTTDNVLLLAYTNRAVDEICQAIEHIHADMKDQYIRIGSLHGTAPQYRPQLLEKKIADANNRQEIREIIEKHRIFVGTIASFMSSDNLLKVKKFQRLVIDEASQLLEPQLLGLLTRFPHFILIGDHRQLPAISVQTVATSTVHHEWMHSLGVNDLRDSYFERMYRRAVAEEWTWAYGRLTHQGRMHAEIMEFPNTQFYDQKLRLMPDANTAAHPQLKPLLYEKKPTQNHDLPDVLLRKRNVFLATPIFEGAIAQKTNVYEAKLCVALYQFFREIYEQNQLPWHAESFGIITPYRAQIACIRDAFQNAGIDPDAFTTDTVERYQGGAREIIVISLCANHLSQLQTLVSLSSEGVDRKLNVALTRARQHLILLGNPEILQNDERYKQFIIENS